MIEWSDEAIAAALRVWLRLSEVGEFRDVRWRETMRQALEAAVEAQNRPDVMGNSLAKALIRATDLEIEAHRLEVENGRLKDDYEQSLEMCMNQALTLRRWSDENEKLHQALHDIYEVYAGSEGTAGMKHPELYLQGCVQEMAYIAGKHKRVGGENG